MAGGELKRFEIPGKPGYFINATDEYARATGLIPPEPAAEPEAEPAAVVTSEKAAVARARVATTDPSEPADGDGEDGDDAEPAAKKRPSPKAR